MGQEAVYSVCFLIKFNTNRTGSDRQESHIVSCAAHSFLPNIIYLFSPPTVSLLSKRLRIEKKKQREPRLPTVPFKFAPDKLKLPVINTLLLPFSPLFPATMRLIFAVHNNLINSHDVKVLEAQQLTQISATDFCIRNVCNTHTYTGLFVLLRPFSSC